MEAKTKETELPKIVRFLLGSSEYDGIWYGDTFTNRKPFWWRKKLREDVSAISERVRELEAINKELVAALENAQKLLGMAAAESLREEIKRYLSGGYAETIQNAVFKDSLGIESVLSKAKQP